MKLQNKKTDVVVDVEIRDVFYDNIAKFKLINKATGSIIAIYNSLAELNAEWKDYEEPLIKDEKIRKAIKVWAVANGFDRVFICRSFEVWGVRYDVGIGTTDILFRGEPPLEPGEQYSIEELCGGEE